MMTTLFIFLISFLLPNTKGGSDFVISGYVRDEKGNLLTHVDIRDETQGIHTITDSTGYYNVVVPSDSVELTFSYIGYTTQKHSYSKNKSRPARRLDILMSESVHELDDFEVQGHRLQADTYEELSMTDFSYLPQATGGGIEGILKTLPGVSSTNELSSQYSVRGGSYDENSVYVNGIEVYRPYLVRTGEQEGLSFVNPSMVGSVNFSAGGFDAKRGDKLSSVLDIEYKKPVKFEASVSGSFLGASGYIGSTTGKFSQMHGIRYKNSSYLLGSLQTKAEYNPNFIDYQTYMTYDFDEKWKLSFLGNISQNTYNFEPETRSTSFGPIGMQQNFTVYFDGSEQDVFRTFFGALKLDYKPSKRVDLSLAVSSFYTDERESYDIQGEYWLSSVVSSSGSRDEITGVGNYYEHARNTMAATVIKVAHDGKFDITENNSLYWGVDVVREMVDENVNEWEMRDSSGYSIPYEPDKVNLYYSLNSVNTLDVTRVHAYIQDEYRLHLDWGLFAFAGGIRMNYWDFNGEATISPRATIAFFPKSKIDMRFRLATGLYYQQPSFKELKDTVTIDGNLTNYLNKDIRSQRAFQVIGGMDLYYTFLRRQFKFTMDVYYKNLQDIITYNVDNVSINYLGNNDARGWAAGVDMKLFGEFVPGVDSWISVSLMGAKEDVYGDGYGYIPRPMDQLFNVSLFFQDYIPGIPQYRVHLLLNFAQGLPVGPPRSPRYMSSTMRAPAYRRVDIGVSRVFEAGKDPWMGRGFFKPFKKIAITLECLNLFGFENVNSYYWITDIYNQQYAVPNYLTGRQFNLKLQIDF